MDPRQNPYTPGAGVRPPALVGREREFETFDIMLARLQIGRAGRSLMITGLRGVGKTVLLSAFAESARLAGWVSIDGEISPESPFRPRMSLLVRRALLELAPRDRWRERLRRAAGVLRSFSLTMSSDGSVTGSIDVEPVEGQADSGDLGEDLGDLLVAVGEAAREHETGVVFLFDEVQFLHRVDLEALIRALHRVAQRGLPLALVGAGLPHLARLAGEAKSYAERLFLFPSLGPLPLDDARAALTQPAAELDVSFDPRAVEVVTTYSEGYPYFIQEYGSVLWDHANGPRVTALEAVEAQAVAEVRLDSSFFRVRVERASEQEVEYLRAMAEFGSEPQRAVDVARVLGRRPDQVGKLRARLIEKGLLYTPSYGRAAFTVPQFDRFLRRSFPLSPPPKGGPISAGGSSPRSRSG
ncbi:MAG: AAA family ATPase [Actinomycetota bacterium]|nr:AAA family ATPase [Actinomycetota bacterium]